MIDKIYKVPTHKVLRFVYNWREWGFKLAWSMLTNPKSWEPVPATLPDYHCPECDDVDCLHCFCVEGTDCESCFEFAKGEQK